MLLFGMFLIPNAHTNITEIDIDFQVGKCNVDTAYSDNARQLANLEKTIQYVNSHPNVRIERLTISGYASPEGPAVKNKQLGETRANALEQYIRSRIDIADSLVVRLPATIPWDMLKAEIRTSQEPGYNEIDRVLHSDSTVIEYLPGRWADRRAFEIQRQKAYKTLNRNVFPSMRSAKAQITTTESVPDGEIALPTADYDLSGISVPAVDIPDTETGDNGEWTRGLYLKTNAVGWAMLISNIAVEVDINKYWSVTLPVYYSALNYLRAHANCAHSPSSPKCAGGLPPNGLWAHISAWHSTTMPYHRRNGAIKTITATPRHLAEVLASAGAHRSARASTG